MNVDTKAAREFANASHTYTGEEVRLWVHNLADEVDSLRAALVESLANQRHISDEMRELSQRIQGHLDSRATYECHDGNRCNRADRSECDTACARLREQDDIAVCAARLIAHADFRLGGVLSADSDPSEIPSNATSVVKARHLAALKKRLKRLGFVDVHAVTCR